MAAKTPLPTKSPLAVGLFPPQKETAASPILPNPVQKKEHPYLRSEAAALAALCRSCGSGAFVCCRGWLCNAAPRAALPPGGRMMMVMMMVVVVDESAHPTRAREGEDGRGGGRGGEGRGGGILRAGPPRRGYLNPQLRVGGNNYFQRARSWEILILPACGDMGCWGITKPGESTARSNTGKFGVNKPQKNVGFKKKKLRLRVFGPKTTQQKCG